MVSVLQDQMKMLGNQINTFSCLMFESMKSKWFLLKNNVFLVSTRTDSFFFTIFFY